MTILSPLQASRPLFALLLGALACAWVHASSLPAGTALPAAEAQSRPDTRASPKPKIYKYLADGTASFSDIPPRTGPYIVLTPSCYACNLTSTINWHATPLNIDAFAAAITAACRHFHADPALVRAIIHAESGFNPEARSRKGAMGLMQLMPATARSLGVADARNPSHNIHGGTAYLAGLLARFKGDVALATAAYNAGPEAVRKYAGIPPFAETQVYVQRVQVLHRRYQGALP